MCIWVYFVVCQLCDWTLVDIDDAAYAIRIIWLYIREVPVNQPVHLGLAVFCSILGSFGHSINVFIIRQVVSGSIAIQIAWLSIAATHNRATRNGSQRKKKGFCFGYVGWVRMRRIHHKILFCFILESLWTQSGKKSQAVFTFIQFMKIITHFLFTQQFCSDLDSRNPLHQVE